MRKKGLVLLMLVCALVLTQTTATAAVEVRYASVTDVCQDKNMNKAVVYYNGTDVTDLSGGACMASNEATLGDIVVFYSMNRDGTMGDQIGYFEVTDTCGQIADEDMEFFIGEKDAFTCTQNVLVQVIKAKG